MKKIAFFVEGQTELIFVERLLQEVAGAKSIEIRRSASRGSGAARLVEIRATATTSGAEYFALLVDCGSDSTVASDVRDHYDGLATAEYSAIVGIRDVYPAKRTDIPKLERWLYHGVKTKPIRPDLLLAVMEVECWFIAEYTHFERIDAQLTCAAILANVGYDPSLIDIEDRDHPAGDLDGIYKIAGMAYKKDRRRVQRTVNALDMAHLYYQVPDRLPRLKSLVIIIDNFLT